MKRTFMSHSCFLCSPNQSWLYEQDDEFFAMLGLGPIVEGYSLLASKAHAPSMLDLGASAADSLHRFSQVVRLRLKPHFGETIITEHGRVPPCEFGGQAPQHRTHCFHAHRLLFPVQVDLTESLHRNRLKVHEYPNFIECRANFHETGEYLYFERMNGSCVIASAPRDLSPPVLSI